MLNFRGVSVGLSPLPRLLVTTYASSFCCGRVIPFSLPLLTSYWKRVGTNPRYQCWFPNGINPHINPMGSLRERHQPKISNSSADGWLDVFQLLWFRFGSPNNSLFVNDKSLKGSTKLRKGDKQMYIYISLHTCIYIYTYTCGFGDEAPPKIRIPPIAMVPNQTK